MIHMKKSTALAAIAASTFVIGAYNEQGHKEPTSTPVAEGQQSAHSIVDDLGIDLAPMNSLLHPLAPLKHGRAIWLVNFCVSRETLNSLSYTAESQATIITS